MRAFQAARLEQEAAFQAAFDVLEADLLALGVRLDAAAARVGQQPLLFSHPVYQYLERRCSLNGVSLHWEPGIMPDDREWRRLLETLREHPAHTLVWEASPLDAIQLRLEELGVTSVVFSPCATRPEGSDLLGTLRDGIDALRQAADG
jgi:zinc transport system substrate-binding protein